MGKVTVFGEEILGLDTRAGEQRKETQFEQLFIFSVAYLPLCQSFRTTVPSVQWEGQTSGMHMQASLVCTELINRFHLLLRFCISSSLIELWTFKNSDFRSQ